MYNNRSLHKNLIVVELVSSLNVEIKTTILSGCSLIPSYFLKHIRLYLRRNLFITKEFHGKQRPALG